MTEDSISATNVAQQHDTPETPISPDLAVSRTKRNVVLTPYLVGLAVAIFLVTGFVLFRSTGQDDSYISYWPAHTLASHGHIVNYSGEAVEQSSSLLWVLMLAAFAAVTRVPVPFLGPLLSITCGALAVFVVSRLATRLERSVQGYAVLFTATAAYLMYWSFSGMEASLAAICATWFAIESSGYVAGLPVRKFGIFVATTGCLLVRPEMGAVLCLMLTALIGALWVRRRLGLLEADKFPALATRTGIVALIVIGVCIAVVAIRIGLFHSPLPEPALVKGGIHPHILLGIRYLFIWCSRVFMLPAVCLALIGTVVTLKEALTARTVSVTRLVCALLLMAYTFFIVWVGGDWMLDGRFLVPVIPIALFLAAYALGRFIPSRLVQPIGLAVVAIQLCGLVWCAKQNSVATSPSSESSAAELTWFDRTDRLFLRDAPVADAVDRVVTRMIATGHPISHIFSGQMGIVMYRLASHHFGQIDVTDRHGLEDRRMAACSLANKQARLLNGISVDYQWYLTHRQALESACAIPSPDIIYDIEPNATSRTRAHAIQKNGYVLVYHRVCDVAAKRTLLAGDQIPVSEFIAVRRDLLGSLRLREIPGDEHGDGTL